MKISSFISLMRKATRKREQKRTSLRMKLCFLSHLRKKKERIMMCLLNASGLTGLEPAASALREGALTN